MAAEDRDRLVRSHERAGQVGGRRARVDELIRLALVEHDVIGHARGVGARAHRRRDRDRRRVLRRHEAEERRVHDVRVLVAKREVLGAEDVRRQTEVSVRRCHDSVQAIDGDFVLRGHVNPLGRHGVADRNHGRGRKTDRGHGVGRHRERSRKPEPRDRHRARRARVARNEEGQLRSAEIGREHQPEIGALAVLAAGGLRRPLRQHEREHQHERNGRPYEQAGPLEP